MRHSSRAGSTIRPAETHHRCRAGKPRLLHHAIDSPAEIVGPGEGKRTELFSRIHLSMRRRSTVLAAVRVLGRINADRMKLERESIARRAFTEAVMAEVLAGVRPGPFVSEPYLLHQILSKSVEQYGARFDHRHSPRQVVCGGSRRRAGFGSGPGNRDPGGRSRADFRTARTQLQRRSVIGTGFRTHIAQRMAQKPGRTIVSEVVPKCGSRLILIQPSGAPSPS